MLKKAVLGVFGAAVIAGLLFGTDAVSYVHTTASQVRESVKESVPVGFEIERARKMITSLGPEIRHNMHVIAKEEVEVDRLRSQATKLASRLDGSRADLVRLKNDLQTGKNYFQYAGRRYSQNQVKIDLANRLNRVKTNDATHINLVKVLDARERGLAAARQKLEGMLAAKQELIVQVSNLEARQKMVEVVQTSSDFNFDDSQLARTRELIREIETRIQVDERMVDVEGDFQIEIPLDESEEVEDDIVNQVARYLGEEIQPEVATVAEITNINIDLN